jgi:hypothetical protein
MKPATNRLNKNQNKDKEWDRICLIALNSGWTLHNNTIYRSFYNVMHRSFTVATVIFKDNEFLADFKHNDGEGENIPIEIIDIEGNIDIIFFNQTIDAQIRDHCAC